MYNKTVGFVSGEIVDLHGVLDLAEGLGGGFLSGIAASAQDLHYRGRVFRQLLTAGPPRS